MAPVKVKSYDELPQKDEELFDFANSKNRLDSTFKDLSTAVAAYEKLLERVDDAAYRTTLKKFDIQSKLCQSIFRASEAESAPSEKIRWIVKGEDLAEIIMRENPDNVEGYYYSAILKGRRAESADIGLSALKLAKKVEELGIKAASIDPAFEHEGPLRLLAMLYAKAPPWPTSVGDIDKAFDFAKRALKLSDYPLNHMVLAEVLIEDDEIEDAAKELNVVLSAPKTGDWALEGENWRPYVMNLLQKIKQ
ncbi:MAG: hypothetical protein JXR91_11975 [Deltaproteobacteria bacterium]|nr:hypothetical protein [Deltaproteobacteria bacterium]